MEETEREITAQEAVNLCEPMLKVLKPFQRLREILTASIRAEQSLQENQNVIGRQNAEIDGLRSIKAALEKQIEERRSKALASYNEQAAAIAEDLRAARENADEEMAAIDQKLGLLRETFAEAEAEYNARLAELNRHQQEAEAKLASVRAEIDAIKSKL